MWAAGLVFDLNCSTMQFLDRFYSTAEQPTRGDNTLVHKKEIVDINVLSSSSPMPPSLIEAMNLLRITSYQPLTYSKDTCLLLTLIVLYILIVDVCLLL